MSGTPDIDVAFVTLASATLCLKLVRPLLARRQVVDLPNHRSLHSKPTIRGGGLGVAAGLLVGLVIGAFALDDSVAEVARMVAVGLTVSTLAVAGFAEDTRGLRVQTRLIIQTMIIGVATGSAVILAGMPPVAGLLAGIWGVFYVNAANFMDGVNGISSMHGTVVGFYFALVGQLSNSPSLMLAGIATGAAFLSFLPWNVSRSRMFLGDVGSYALGAAAWVLSLSALTLGIPLLPAVAPMLVYTADVVTTLLRRAAKRAPLVEAHREHVYQQVQQLTKSHGLATVVATIATIGSGAAGVWNLVIPGATVGAASCLALLVALYLVSPRLLTMTGLPLQRSDR